MKSVNDNIKNVLFSNLGESLKYQDSIGNGQLVINNLKNYVFHITFDIWFTVKRNYGVSSK